MDTMSIANNISVTEFMAGLGIILVITGGLAGFIHWAIWRE